MPSRTHSIGLHSSRGACARRSSEAAEWDVEAALGRALEEAQGSTREACAKVTGNGSDNMRRQVPPTCALAKTDDRGDFAPLFACGPLSRIPYGEARIDWSQRHLLKSVVEERWSILTRKGEWRATRSRLHDPMAQPHVVMRW